MDSPRSLGLAPLYWRDGQLETIEKIIQSDKDIVIIDAPTGSGKSIIALAAGLMSNDRTFILTANKSLQDQYVKEGGNRVKSIKGRRNYPCIMAEFNEEMAIDLGVDWSVTPDEAPCSIGYDCPAKSYCPYFVDRGKALKAKVSIHNYQYWMGESEHVGGFSGGGLVVCDEGHMLDDMICEYQSIHIDTDTQKMLHLKSPESMVLGDWVEYGRRAWISCEKRAEKEKEYSVGRARWKNLQKEMGKLAAVDKDNRNMVVCEDKAGGWRGIVVKPIWPSGFREMFLGEKGRKVVIMSATILDPKLFAQTIGIEDGSYEFIKLPYTFPPDIRPIFYRPVAGVNKENMYRAAKGLAGVIDSVLRDSKGEKGVIHGNSFALMEAILPHINNIDRVIVHRRGDKRGEKIEEFKQCKDGKWLFSPSVTHGEDLSYDLARRQIILKMPYPDMGDVVVKTRMRQKKWWYKYKTVQTLVQTIGRVTRAADDYGDTTIVDSHFSDLIDMLPKEIQEAIQ